MGAWVVVLPKVTTMSSKTVEVTRRMWLRMERAEKRVESLR